MPAPPRSLALTPFFFAAVATRSASAMGSSRGPSGIATQLLRVDLDDYRLEVGHLLQREAAADPPDAAALAGPAAEGQVRLPVVRGLVDVDPSRLELVGHAQRARKVARVNRAEQAVRRVVGESERLGLAAELDHRSDRAECLLAAYKHVGLHVVEAGGLVVEASGKPLRPLAAEDDLRAAADGVGDVVVHLGGDAFVVERPERGIGRERIAQAQLLRRLLEAC